DDRVLVHHARRHAALPLEAGGDADAPSSVIALNPRSAVRPPTPAAAARGCFSVQFVAPKSRETRRRGQRPPPACRGRNRFWAGGKGCNSWPGAGLRRDRYHSWPKVAWVAKVASATNGVCGHAATNPLPV